MAAIKTVMRQLMRRPRTFLAGIALLTSICLCLEYWAMTRRENSHGTFCLVMRRDLPEGTLLSLLDVAVAQQRSVGAPGGALTDQDLEFIRGATLKKGLSRNDVLTWASIDPPLALGLGRKVPQGKRAYYLPVEGGLRVRRGDAVDIIFTPRDENDSPLVLVEEALVLEVTRNNKQPETVLALSQQDIETVEKGRQTGKLNLALRNPLEKAPASRKPRKKPPPRARRRGIEVWAE